MATHLEQAIAWEAVNEHRGVLRPLRFTVALAKAGMLGETTNSGGGPHEFITPKGREAIERHRRALAGEKGGA